MSIHAADLRKLVKIVRQYEIIYGGGISSSDAAVREECESLVARLESELGGGIARPSGRGAGKASKLPSLIEAKRSRKPEKAPRPVSARASELASLAKPRATPDTDAAPGEGKRATKTAAAKRAEREPEPAPKGRAKAAATEPEPKGKKASAKGARTSAASKADSAAAKGDLKDAAVESKSAGRGPSPDVRSRPASVARAFNERADRTTDKARSANADGTGPDRSRRFAATHLFDAFSQGKLPKYGGFIVCVRFAEELSYAVIEIIGYENLQDIYPEGDTLVFKSVGCKLYAIVEPTTYLLKSVEPVNRPSDQMVPYRFSELMRITTKRFQSVLIGLKPVFMPTSFSVFKPAGEDLAVLFYDTAEVYANLQDFMIMILRDRLGVPAPDSRKAAEAIARGAREFRLWLDEA